MIVVAHVLGFCAQTRQVRARIGFAIALTPSNLTVNYVRNIFLLLLFCCVKQQCWAQHVQSKTTQRSASTNTRHFFAKNFSLRSREATAAILGWPTWCCPTLCSHALEPELLAFALKNPFFATPTLILIGSHGLTHILWAIRLKPVACFLPKCV